jgi:DNA-binding MarR family transcriptional regulator
MQDAGLVRREVPPRDRRSIDVVMTDAGRARFLEARRLHGRGIAQRFCAHITPEEGRVLRDALERVRRANEPPA